MKNENEIVSLKGKLLKNVRFDEYNAFKILYVVDEIKTEKGIRYIYMGRDYSHIEVIERKAPIEYSIFRSTTIKKEFKSYYKEYLKFQKLQNEANIIESNLSEKSKTIINLIQEQLPTIGVLVKKIISNSNTSITSWSLGNKGEITISKENDLGTRRSDLVCRIGYDDNYSIIDEKSLCKAYAPIEKSKNFFKQLKHIKLKKIDNSCEAGEKESVSVYTNYLFETNLNKKNYNQAQQEIQWVIDNI